MLTAANHKRWLIIILAGALLLRLGAAFVVQTYVSRIGQEFLIEGDANGYWHLGKQIAERSEYTIYDPPRRVLRMPGFPVLLAGCISLFGSSQWPARLVLSVVGTVACGLVYWLGCELVDRRTGLVACGLAAVSPAIVGFTPLILSETMFAACLLASLIAMARLLRRHQHAVGAPVGFLDRTTLLALLTGALVSVACYVRPSWLLVGPLFGLALVLMSKFRQVAMVHAVLLVAGMIVLLPWGYRNQGVTGHFVLTTLWVGASLYDGLSPNATGESDMTFFDRDNLLAGMSEYEVDRYYRAAAWDFARANPGRTAHLAIVKLGRFWNPCPNAAQFQNWGACLALGGFFVSVVILAMLGSWQMRGRPEVLLLTVGPILYFTAIHTVFVSSLRYRLPAEYPLLIASAIGLLSVWPRQKLRPTPPSPGS